MKFCDRRKYEYISSAGVATSSHYVTPEDVLQMHGAKFMQQWNIMAHHKKTTKFGTDAGYFYDDYQHFARATDSYLNVVG